MREERERGRYGGVSITGNGEIGKCGSDGGGLGQVTRLDCDGKKRGLRSVL